MPNLSRLPDERSPYRAPSMIWLARTWNCDAKSIARRIAAASLLALASAALVWLIGIMLIYKLTEPEWLLWINRGR